MALSDAAKSEITQKLLGGGSVRGLAKSYATSENVVRGLKRKAGLPVGDGGGGTGGSSATFEGPPPSSFAAPKNEAPVPTLTSDVMGEAGSFLFWLWSLRFGQGWELDQNERRDFGQATSQFLPNLPGWVVERIAKAVVFIRPAQVMVRIIKRRLDAVAAYHRSQDGVGGPHAEEAPPAPPPLRVVPPPQAASPPNAEVNVGSPEGPDARTLDIARAISAEQPGMQWNEAVALAVQQRQAELKAERWAAQNGGGASAYSATTLLGKS